MEFGRGRVLDVGGLELFFSVGDVDTQIGTKRIKGKAPGGRSERGPDPQSNLILYEKVKV